MNSLAALPHCRLASGSSDYTIRVWDLNSIGCERVLMGHTHVRERLVYASELCLQDMYAVLLFHFIINLSFMRN